MKSKFKKITTMLLASLSFVALAITSFCLGPTLLNNVQAKEESYTLDIGGKNGDEWGFLSKSGYKNVKNTYRYVDIGFDSSILSSDGKLQLKKSEGTIYNLANSPITGLYSLRVDYTSDAKMTIRFGDAAKPSTGEAYAIDSGVTYPLSLFAKNKYFALKSGAKVTYVDKVTLVYTCRGISEPLDPSQVYPVKLSVQQNKTSYAFGTSIDVEKDIQVTAIMNDDSTKILKPYDNNGPKNGYVIGDILSDKHGEVTSLPQPFNELDTYLFYISYSENGMTVKDDAGLLIEVVGGTATSVAPTSLDIKNNAPIYSIGETFNSDGFVVKGNWPDYGGYEQIMEGDGTNGYLITSTQDLSKPFDKVTNFDVTISYRGLSQTFNIEVTDQLQKSKITYDYNNYDEDRYYLTDIMSTEGSPKTLVVPIWFKDSNKYITPTQKSQILIDIEKVYFGTSQDTGWESVTSYYEKDSYNQLHIRGKVTDWMNVDTISYNTSEDDTVNLVLQASKWAKQFYTGEQWKEFDTDKDGYLDAVILIYAAPDYLSLEDAGAPAEQINGNMWAYCFWTQINNMNVNDPGANVFFWASYDFMYNDKTLTLDAHTYIHEMGHILGLPDYYDVGGVNSPAGDFSMQDMNIGGHDPMSKLTYGWCEPYVPTKSTSITLNDFDSSGDLILLSPEFTGSAFDEYILLEYFTPTGLNYRDTHHAYLNRYPKGTLQSGLRVWHCDQRLFGIKNGKYVKTTYTKMEPGLEGLVYEMSNTTDLGKETEGYVTALPEYRRFDNLALLNHSYTKLNEYPFKDSFSSRHLWKVGDSFDMFTYQASFPNPGKLNSGKELGFSFSVTAMTETTITVNITKL